MKEIPIIQCYSHIAALAEIVSYMNKEISEFILKNLYLFGTYSADKIAYIEGLEEKKKKNPNVKDYGPSHKCYKQKKRGVIPAKSFNVYLKAWEQTKTKPINVAELKNMTDEEWQRRRNYAVNELKRKMELRTKALNVILKAESIFKSETPSGTLEQDVNNSSKQFLYLFDTVFKAFCSLTFDDYRFLKLFHERDKTQREKLQKRLNVAETVEQNKALSALAEGEGSLWMKAINICSGFEYIEPTIKTEKLKKSITRKINTQLEKRNFIDEMLQMKPNNVYVLRLVLKEFAQKDATFGEKEIKTLIIFKYFLTGGERKKLLSEIEAKK